MKIQIKSIVRGYTPKEVFAYFNEELFIALAPPLNTYAAKAF